MIQANTHQSVVETFLKDLGIISCTCFEKVRYRNHIIAQINPVIMRDSVA